MSWVAVAACLVVSFIFSGIEAGLLSMNRVRLRHRVKQRDRAAMQLDALVAQPERLLVTVLIVTNLMNIFAITLTTQELVQWLGVRGYVVALILALPIYLLGLEVLPKSLFRRFPYRALAALAGPLRIADALLAPVHWVGHRLATAFFGGRPPSEQKLFVAREDFKYLTIEGERTGMLTKVERQMIHNVIDFRSIAVKDVMIPIERVHMIAAGASIEELLAQSRATKVERWPVRASDGAITGLVSVFDIALDGRQRGVVETFQRRPVKVKANEPASSALRKLRAARATAALVIAPNGEPLGIVTWENLIQRLVSVSEKRREE